MGFHLFLRCVPGLARHSLHHNSMFIHGVLYLQDQEFRQKQLPRWPICRPQKPQELHKTSWLCLLLDQISTASLPLTESQVVNHVVFFWKESGCKFGAAC